MLTKQDTVEAKDSQVPLLLMCLTFLLLTLTVTGYSQWKNEHDFIKQDAKSNIHNTLGQAILLSKWAARSNDLFFSAQKDNLLRAVKQDHNSLNDIFDALKKILSDVDGFFLFDANGAYINGTGKALHHNERRDIVRHISATHRRGVFALSYNGNGAYYTFNTITLDNRPYIFIVRRPYAQFSKHVHSGQFKHFELLLLMHESDQILIRHGHYFDTENLPTLNKNEKTRLLYRARFEGTAWDVVAIRNELSPLALILPHIKLSIALLVFFSFLSASVWSYNRRNKRKIKQLEEDQRNIEMQANQALQSVSDVFISTDCDGNILYLNSKACLILDTTSAPATLIGQNLYHLLPQPNAIWNQPLEHVTAQACQLESFNPELQINVEGELHSFAQRGSVSRSMGKSLSFIWVLRDITDIKLGAQKLADSQMRYKSLFDESGVPHYLFEIRNKDTGTPGNLSLVNINKPAMVLMEAEDRQLLLRPESVSIYGFNQDISDHIEQCLRSNESNFEFECELITLKKTKKYVWGHLSIYREQGYAFLTLIDISQRTQSLNIIREQEAFWSSIIKASPDLIYVCTKEGNGLNILFNNHRFQDFLGYSDNPDHLDFSDIFSKYLVDSDRPRARELIENIVNLEPSQRSEESFTFHGKDSEQRIIHFTSSVFDDSNRSKTERKYLGIARDITESVKSKQRVIDSRLRYKLLADNMRDIVWTIDEKMKLNFISASINRIIGYTADTVLSRSVESFVPIETIKSFREKLRDLSERVSNNMHRDTSDEEVIYDINIKHRNGYNVTLELRASPMFDENQNLSGFLGVARDVTQLRMTEKELKLTAGVFINSNEGIIITDEKYRIIKTNRAFHDITCYTEDDVSGKTPGFMLLLDAPGSSRNIAEITSNLKKNHYWQGEQDYICAKNIRHTAYVSITVINDYQGNIENIIILMTDISERKAIEERINKLAYFDSLTGLANRINLNEHLDSIIKRCRKNRTFAAVLFIDLDRFKPINDTMGHPAGDKVLEKVAKRLIDCTKHGDFLARVGGDEFIVVISDLETEELCIAAAQKVALRVQEKLNKPYRIQRRELFISASVGISLFPQNGKSVLELLRAADMAMYQAKENGRDHTLFFDHSMQEKALHQMDLENNLRQILDTDQLSLHFQPQYASGLSRAICAESLLRWNHPEKGFIPPDVFIPILEDTGIIIEVGEWVLQKACEAYVSWQQSGCTHVERIAVNVSARQFDQDNFVDIVKNILLNTGMKPDQLELELTESALLSDIEGTLDRLKELRDLGVHTAIDDFGTGYSSLSYLKQLPIDILKIDRSFVKNLPHNTDDAQITNTIIAMAHTMDMGVIAEGVETQEQLELLNTMGCEVFQGYLLSRPLPADQVIDALKMEHTNLLFDGNHS